MRRTMLQKRKREENGPMLKMYTATTSQIDSPEDAVAEITAQLKDKQLLKNTFGIAACHTDYIETQTVAELRKALSFDFIGCTSFGSASNIGGGTEQLSLTVLTSDELTFASAFSREITADGYAAPLDKVYEEAKEALGGEPSFIFAFAPITTNLSGTQILKEFDRISGGKPVFGTLANDTSTDYQQGGCFRNSEFHRYKAAVLLVKGDFKPRFYTAAIAAKNIQQQNAVVTESTGYLISKINDIPLMDYFVSIGIIQQKHLAAVTMIPLMVNLGDGTKPFANSMYGISEQGAFCGCETPVGAMVSFAEVDYNSIMETCDAALKEALADAAQNAAAGIIAIPCLSRPIVISPAVNDEIKKSLSIVGDKVPFSLLYSGGEFCPVYNKQGGLVNRFHNLTYTLMVF
jgi:hypothetical protein